MLSYFPILALMSLVPAALAHGTISSPTPRKPGAAYKAACGEQVYNNQASDALGNVQGILQVASSQKDYNPAKCDVWLCKGYQFDDNSANIQTYTAGQKIDMAIRIGAPHTGVANVSIVDTKANSVIGDALISFDDYASVSHTMPANNSAFSITMPDLGSKCATAGDCVIQWYWNAATISQTYESCIDFTMGSGSPAVSPAAPVSSAAPTTMVTSVKKPASPSTASSTAAAPATTSAPADDADDCEDEEPIGAAVPTVAKVLSTSSATSAAPVATSPTTDEGDEGEDCEDEPTASASVPAVGASAPATTGTSSTTAAAKYAQCGGTGWTGPTTCASGTCTVQNPYYSQCI
ncbi:chitin binding protein [Venturia nashicola]|uniref:Chitin binding protein n=1 Tax=Venturia nashicola TaxID=86259 RepID=A0A4Z1PH49_9PEZI|nr:chitin binding protein [Venturia nashicola]TLD37124.1 chitin binding protein [Venturia nashicola]